MQLCPPPPARAADAVHATGTNLLHAGVVVHDDHERALRRRGFPWALEVTDLQATPQSTDTP